MSEKDIKEKEQNLEEISEQSYEESLDDIPRYESEEEYDDEDEDIDINKIIKITLGIAGVGAVIGLMVGGFFFFNKPKEEDKPIKTNPPIVETQKPTTTIKPTAKPTTKPTKEPVKEDSTLKASKLIDMSFKEVKKYLSDNGYTNVRYSMVYSDTVSKDKLINVSPNEIINKSDEIRIKVSLGERKVEEINIPNFATKSINEAKEWANKNNIKLNIVNQPHDYLEKDFVISQNPDNGIVKANTELTIYNSTGPIKIGNFKDRNKDELAKWVEDINKSGAKITVQYVEEFSSATKNTIIEISHTDTKVLTTDTIKVKVSKGNEEVQNFLGQDIELLRKFAKDHNFKLEETTQYSSLKKNVIISQNPHTGALAKDGVIYVTISDGQYEIPDFKGKTYKDALIAVDTANQKGANVKVIKEEELTNDVPEGTVAWQSFDGTNLKLFIAKALPKPDPEPIPDVKPEKPVEPENKPTPPTEGTKPTPPVEENKPTNPELEQPEISPGINDSETPTEETNKEQAN